MTSIERTAYPRFKRQFTTKELTEIYTPTSSEIAFAYSTTKGENNVLNLLVILKSFQRLVEVGGNKAPVFLVIGKTKSLSVRGATPFKGVAKTGALFMP